MIFLKNLGQSKTTIWHKQLHRNWKAILKILIIFHLSKEILKKRNDSWNSIMLFSCYLFQKNFIQFREQQLKEDESGKAVFNKDLNN
jgi:hypothetical protein